MNYRKLTSLAIAGLMFISTNAAQACTSFLLKAQNGDLVYARTMEFSLPLSSQLLVVPRNFAIKATGPEGKTGSGLSYTTKYGAVGMNGLGLPEFVDGMNEIGLVLGMQFFPSLADFQAVEPSEAANSIASYPLGTYILTQFASVDEVKMGLPKIKVNRTPLAQFNGPLPIHLTIHDAEGKSIVVEYVAGQLQITDNPTSVMTNSPSFAWHLANLGQFANAIAAPARDFKINGKSYAPWSTGSGMNGIPGDFSSPTRFIRAAFFVANAPKMKDAQASLNIAWHFLSQFDLPPGAVGTAAGGAAGGGVAGYEITEWSVAADIKNGIYQFKTFDNASPRQVSLKSLDLDANALRYIPINQKQVITDLSK